MFSVPTRAHYTGDPVLYDAAMRRSAWALAAIALAATAACGSPKGEEFTTTDAATIRQRNQEFVDAFNARDVPRILDIYAENSVFMPPNLPIIRGKDALKIFYTDLLNQGASNLRLDVFEVAGHGPIAYQSGSYELDYKPATGTPRHDRGKYLFILRNMSGTWRLQYTMWNSDQPAENMLKPSDD
jgi:ketosteroid isomerase-like protein